MYSNVFLVKYVAKLDCSIAVPNNFFEFPFKKFV